MTPDRDLLRQYVSQGHEGAFTEIVRNHVDLVYSAAYRVTGDAQVAQDVTQTVFTKLARRAKALAGHQSLVGWLHTTTRYTAINAIRGEARRRIREQEAHAMQNEPSAPPVPWEQLRPMLDEAVDQLRDGDRQIVLLRFFKGLSHQEIGATLGMTENAANKRVNRALEKLREYFVRRGVTASSVLLAEAIMENSVQAAPVGLVAQVTTASLAGSGAAVGSDFLWNLIYMSTKTKIILAVFIIIGLVVTLTAERQSSSASPIYPVAALSQGAVSLPQTPQARVAAPVVAPVSVRSLAIFSNNSSVPAVSDTASSTAEAKAADFADLTTRVNVLIQGKQVILGTSPDIWAPIPGRENAIELREGIRTIPLVEDRVNSLYSTVYYLTTQDRFYIDWRPGPNQGGCYGPFSGNPYDVLNLPPSGTTDGPYIVKDGMKP